MLLLITSAFNVLCLARRELARREQARREQAHREQAHREQQAISP
jgi:hypothetical protein